MLSLLSAFSMLSGPLQAQQVNIYSFRQDFLIDPLLEEFEDETGILINIVSGDADHIIKRLQAEGANSFTDLLLTVDAGRLERAKRLGLLQTIESDIIHDRLPERYREKEGAWFGLSKRARPIVYNTKLARPDAIKSYTDLADPKWKGKVCLRSSSNIYNQSLVASYLAHHGEEKTRSWIKGMVSNLAQRPQGSDVDQIKYIAGGVCHFAFVNSYYLARMKVSKNSNDRSSTENIGVIWPDQHDQGAHINVSGVGVVKYAPNKESAVKFIEFLLSEKAQQIYAKQVLEYPVVENVPISPVVDSLGQFKEDNLKLERLGEFNEQAKALMSDLGWD